MEKQPVDLGTVGIRVNNFMKMVEAALTICELTEDELAGLERFNNQSEAVGCIFDPTEWMQIQRVDGFKRVQERINLIRLAEKLITKETEIDKNRR